MPITPSLTAQSRPNTFNLRCLTGCLDLPHIPLVTWNLARNEDFVTNRIGQGKDREADRRRTGSVSGGREDGAEAVTDGMVDRENPAEET